MERTFFRVTPGLFVAFVLFNGASQAAFGGYLQTSTIAVASLFGPQAMQAVMSGQAAVAVAVSAVQVLSSSLFLWRATPETISAKLVGSPEQGSARVFFAFSTVFLIISAVAHNVLVSTQAYKILVAPIEQKSFREQGTTEESLLLTSEGPNDYSSDKASILRVAKANITYEIAGCYIFIVTLVRDANTTFSSGH
ncbi:hypothetical protein DXG03_007411 [Asterophora parasitica]|uniref:Uncharacterized protein n=1 Tax=Asterophora parasitica TaxID=117018 RepID=A0A9P7G833_9AGAR|nr:hypothetical protein DXG03_007411 [Asterophora parasitica]